MFISLGETSRSRIARSNRVGLMLLETAKRHNRHAVKRDFTREGCEDWVNIHKVLKTVPGTKDMLAMIITVITNVTRLHHNLFTHKEGSPGTVTSTHTGLLVVVPRTTLLRALGRGTSPHQQRSRVAAAGPFSWRGPLSCSDFASVSF